MKKWKIWIVAVSMALLAGCSNETASVETTSKAESQTETDSVPAETLTEAQTIADSDSLSSIAQLLGMKDEDTKALLGGSEENWSADHSFYIGRIFQANLYGETIPVYTTCREDGIVDSVSMHLVSGERKVTDEEIAQWTERLTQHIGTSASEESAPSEGGSKDRTWRKDGKIAVLRYMEDQLSITFQELTGELEAGEEVSQEITVQESVEENSSENKTAKEAAGNGALPIDNFDVDSAEAAEFAGKIKTAVSEQDLEALADLAAYPLYIGFTSGSQSVESKEDFLSLGKEKIFTEGLMTSIAQADETNLPPSRAGFVLTKEGGTENIIFGLRDGKLAISGINY